MRWLLDHPEAAECQLLRTRASVPILKFLCTLRLDSVGALAEALDSGEDVFG